MTTTTAPTATTTDNATKVFGAVKDGASTVKQVTELTGLAASTVKTHLRHLAADGKVTATPGAKQSDPTVFAVKAPKPPKRSPVQAAAHAALASPDPLTENGIQRHPEARPNADRELQNQENAELRNGGATAAPVRYRRNFTAAPGTGGQHEGGPALHTAKRTPVSGRAVKGENAKLLLRFFDTHRDEQYTARQVRDAIDSRWGVSNKLYELAEAGLVKRVPRGGRPGYLWSYKAQAEA